MLTARLASFGRRFASRFGRDRSGVSATEFALIAPILAILLGGSVEFSGALTAANRSTFVADALAEMVSRVDHTITTDELRNYIVASALIDPDIVRYAKKAGVPIESAFKITVSSVVFEKKVLTCLISCKYDAKTVFSYTMNGTARPCGKLTSAAKATDNVKQLPDDVFGPGSLVVVDVETFYMPIMPIRLGETINFKRSSYFRPRYVPRVNFENNCNGY